VSILTGEFQLEVTAVVVVLWLVWYTVEVVLLVFAGTLVAVLLSSLASMLSVHMPLPYRWALAVVVIGIVGVSALAAWLWAPRIMAEGKRRS